MLDTLLRESPDFDPDSSQGPPVSALQRRDDGLHAGEHARLEALMRREVQRHGGFTTDWTGAPVREGLAVCADPATILSFSEDQWPAEAVSSWLLAHEGRLRSGGVYLGGWHDIDRRTVHLELSYVFPREHRTACLAVAVAHRRRAIFDLGERRVIAVPASMDALVAPPPASGPRAALSPANLERHRREYFLDGYTLLPNLFPAETIARWRDWAMRHKALGLHLDAVADETWVYQAPAQRHAYAMIDGLVIGEHLPDMVDCYRDLAAVLSEITFQTVVASPYPRSGVNLLVYDRPEAEIGWHHDTNPITLLLYLTDNEEGGTECRLLPRRPDQEEHEHRVIRPRAGTALLMQGRWVLHRGLSVEKEVKIASPWNYYSTADQWRPAGFDQRIYEGGGRR